MPDFVSTPMTEMIVNASDGIFVNELPAIEPEESLESISMLIEDSCKTFVSFQDRNIVVDGGLATDKSMTCLLILCLIDTQGQSHEHMFQILVVVQDEEAV